MKSNSLDLTSGKYVIPTATGSSYTILNKNGVNVKFGSIIVTPETKTVKGSRKIKYLYNNTTNCRVKIKCGRKKKTVVKQSEGSFDVQYDLEGNTLTKSFETVNE